MRKAAWILLLLGTVIATSAQDVETFTPSFSDLVYGEAEGQELTLDVYLPEPRSVPIPVLIYIHGGGWRAGDKSAVPEFLRKSVLDAGIALVSVNYRLSDSDPYPAQVDDTTRAVQFVRSMAEEWDVREDRIAVMGTSAGAHLAMWIGFHDDRADPASPDPIARQSSRVSAVVNYYGPVNFHLLKTVEHFHPAYMQLFGLDRDDPLDLVGDAKLTAASPATYISPGDPPVFTFHGTDDRTVPIEHARDLIAKLKENSIPFEEFLLERGVHGYQHKQAGWPDFEAATLDFLKKHLLENLPQAENAAPAASAR